MSLAEKVKELEDKLARAEDKIELEDDALDASELEAEIEELKERLEVGGPVYALAEAVRARLARHTFPETDEPELYSALDAFDVAVAGR